MPSVLYTASTFSHILNFHLPYLRRFRELGWQVEVACGGPVRDIPFADGAVSLPLEKKMSSPANFQAASQLRAMVIRQQYDLIITHTSLAAFFTRWALRGLKHRPKLINVVHGYLFDDETSGLKRGLLTRAETMTAPQTDLLLTMNAWDTRWAMAHRAAPRVEEIPGMGVDLTRFRTAPDARRTMRDRLGLSEGDVALLYAAEFSGRKSQHTLLEALPGLPENVKLLLPGSGALLDDCRAQAASLGVADRTVFPGQVHDMPRWLAAADIAGTLPVMKVSDHLTWLAEAMIDAVVQQAWLQMVARYGQPTHLHDRQGRGFAVVGYGKLGGWELGYSSDLDLIFLHDCPMDVMTDGEREIDGRQFYLRLAQRIMHLFSTRTSSGILYEVDARLRPSGAAGMLVTSADAFADYQRNEAWTWEHQALVRARVVYGDPALQARFDAIRRDILTTPREGATLQTEVREMREKMRAHLGNKHPNRFDIKADAGGITDIEFITQYLVLRYASDKPKLTRWSDNVRILELLAQNDIMDEEEARALTHAYTTLRDALHHLALQELPGHVAPEAFSREREQVSASWQKWLMA